MLSTLLGSSHILRPDSHPPSSYRRAACYVQIVKPNAFGLVAVRADENIFIEMHRKVGSIIGSRGTRHNARGALHERARGDQENTVIRAFISDSFAQETEEAKAHCLYAETPHDSNTMVRIQQRCCANQTAEVLIFASLFRSAANAELKCQSASARAKRAHTVRLTAHRLRRSLARAAPNSAHDAAPLTIPFM